MEKVVTGAKYAFGSPTISQGLNHSPNCQAIAKEKIPSARMVIVTKIQINPC